MYLIFPEKQGAVPDVACVAGARLIPVCLGAILDFGEESPEKERKSDEGEVSGGEILTLRRPPSTQAIPDENPLLKLIPGMIILTGLSFGKIISRIYVWSFLACRIFFAIYSGEDFQSFGKLSCSWCASSILL